MLHETIQLCTDLIFCNVKCCFGSQKNVAFCKTDVAFGAGSAVLAVHMLQLW